ncbi:MAG: hypothetical protein ACRDV3_07515 [Acidothermaceae bacterium]
MARSLLMHMGNRRAADRTGAIEHEAAARYASAMHSVSAMGDALLAARAAGASISERRRLHARVDQELVRAYGAADEMYHRLLTAAGGPQRGDTDPGVQLWKRRLNTALTVRSQHQLAEIDDAGVLAPAAVAPLTRAAYGPHQAGMDFEH